MEQLGLKYILFFILIVSPGLMFRRFYFKGEFSKQFNSKNWTSFVLWSAMLGVAIQFLSFLLTRTILKSIDFRKFLKNYFDFKDSDDVFSKAKTVYVYLQNLDFGMMYQNLKSIIGICGYYIVVLFVAYILAQLSYALIRAFKWDRKFSVFRFQNYWNYYFRGEIKDFPEFKFLNSGKYIHTMADVLIQTASGDTKMYKGVLSQYTIEPKTNKLETIYLTRVLRWKYCKDKEKMIQVEVPGDCMIIPYASVLNLNLEYIREPKANYKLDPDSLFIPLYIGMVLYVLFSNSPFFYSNKYVFVTVILKLYYIVFSLSLVVNLYYVFLIIITLYRYLKHFFAKKRKNKSNVVLKRYLRIYFKLNFLASLLITFFSSVFLVIHMLIN